MLLTNGDQERCRDVYRWRSQWREKPKLREGDNTQSWSVRKGEMQSPQEEGMRYNGVVPRRIWRGTYGNRESPCPHPDEVRGHKWLLWDLGRWWVLHTAWKGMGVKTSCVIFASVFILYLRPTGSTGGCASAICSLDGGAVLRWLSCFY